MKIGVTIRFQNSYFSGSVPQVSAAIARTLMAAGHDVTLLYPKNEPSWFIDVPEYKAQLPPITPWTNTETFDTVIEVSWAFTPDERKSIAQRRIGFAHYAPIFYDIESCVYNWNPTVRNFTNLTELWTYDLYSKHDLQYLEFLSNLPVQTVPYVWDADPLDMFVGSESIREWSESASVIETMIPDGTPQSLSWCARIVESNFSNTSHCTIPLTIVSEIRKNVAPIRFAVHNAEAVSTHPFFQTNIVQNLLLPDISGNMVPRVRLPELRKEKTLFIAHSRFRPLKSYLLDAHYLGFPVIHNCKILKELGAPYYYELNQIREATAAFGMLDADYKAKNGFFAEGTSIARQTRLRERFSPSANSAAYEKVLAHVPAPTTTTAPATATATQSFQSFVGNANQSKTLRVAFAHMWDDFQPRYNFFMYLLSWIGSQNGINVELDEVSPNIVFFGPLSNGSEKKWKGVSKVFYSGENCPANTDPDTFLNIGFEYKTEPNYIRLPLWILEINWWGADVEKIVNPKPVSIAAATSTTQLNERKKFCAFVASNPNNSNRNAAFMVLNQWRGVESAGRLFCNRSGGPLPGGRGGGGGELAKVEYYKDFKFVITFENSSAPGYTTEKLFHAKVAGAVPIYWGDPFVDRDFDSNGFINANGIRTPSELVDLVQKVANDETVWEKMASIPALSASKRTHCEQTMTHLGAKIFQKILNITIEVKDTAWASSELFGAIYENPIALPHAMQQQPQQQQQQMPQKRVIVSAANSKFVEAALNLFTSLNQYDSDCKKIVYVWPDVDKRLYPLFEKQGVLDIRLLPTNDTSITPWADYWDPKHFAWKLWIHANLLKDAEQDSCFLYLDAGTVISGPIRSVWEKIHNDGVFLIDDPTQNNARWCHDSFIKNMNATQSELASNQLLGGLIGFKAGGVYNQIASDALLAANNRSTIVGEKWHRYSEVCMGHRHDQSILSILTDRAHLPRVTLKDYYCDSSMRAAKQFGVPFYVHRGNFKEFEPFTKGIDEAYVINLQRRKDRLNNFHGTHPELKGKTYVLPAVDGRTLTLTPQLVECFRNNDFKWKKAIMGCALSHLSLWEKLANDTICNSYLIMEDDVHFANNWLQVWNKIVDVVPKDADAIYLGGVLPPNAHAFPRIIDPVNAYFARVKKNNFFGGHERRYFHFCNYSYIVTKTGAQKLVTLIKERGIFTSGDHMIVNHGDDLLNIYFTTPLLAKCMQDNDPVYQKSQFNNFDRIDTFDSDLWNNDDRFTEEEINCARLGTDAPTAQNAAAAAAAATTASLTDDEQQVSIWNTFLKAIAMQNTKEISEGIQNVFTCWSSMTTEQIVKHLGWFRIFEQMLLTKHAPLQPYIPAILSAIDTLFPSQMQHIWNKVKETYAQALVPNTPGIELLTGLPSQSMTAWIMNEIEPEFLECEWLDAMFPKPLNYKKFKSLDTLLETQGTPLIVFQKIQKCDVGLLFENFAKEFERKGKQMVVLHLSDEFANDTISFYDSPAVKAVIRNYWRPGLPTKAIVIPLGYASGRSAHHLPPSASFQMRNNIFMFSGSLDRKGRAEMLAKLSCLAPNEIHTRTFWSDSMPQNGIQYNESVRNAKFIPCFKGSCALESFRIYEALEHGAIPIYVPSESTLGTEDELKEQFGTNPLLGFPSWDAAIQTLPMLASKEDVMEKHRQTLQNWWSEKKAETRRRIASVL